MLGTLPFLVLVGAVLPLLAWIGRRGQLAAAARPPGSETGEIPENGGGGEPTAETSVRAIALQVVVLQGVVAAFAWIALAAVDASVRWRSALSVTTVLLSLAILGGTLLYASIEARKPLGPEETVRRLLRKISPLDPFYLVTVGAASVGEELAYRGVLTTLLAGVIGPVPAAVASATLFGLGHLGQGWRGASFSALFGLALQAVVALSGGLGLAIFLHLAYDLAAAWLVRILAPPPEFGG